MSNFIQGERFLIPLGDDEEEENQNHEENNRTKQQPQGDNDAPPHSDGGNPAADFLVADVLERPSGKKTKPPLPPTFKPSSASGFPSHGKFGASRISRFKAARQDDAAAKAPTVTGNSSRTASSAAAAPNGSSSKVPLNKNLPDREAIDEENKALLASMSETEIEEARREVMNMLSPEAIARLMRRKEPIRREEKEGAGDELIKADGKQADGAGEASTKSVVDPSDGDQTSAKHDSSKKVAAGENPECGIEAGQESEGRTMEEKPTDGAHTTDPTLSGQAEKENPDSRHSRKAVTFDIPEGETDADPQAEFSEQFNHDPLASIHFPRAPAPPKLDPSSPNFLADLQSHYFPSLSHDPTKLEWLGHVVSPPKESLPSSIPVSHLRFDLNGRILGPTAQAKLPVNLGLHHHGEDPDKAGYKISELAILARSTYPPQRCMASLILGRILWRLGTNEFGKLHDEVDGSGNVVAKPEEMPTSEEEKRRQEELSELAQGLETHMEQERIVDILMEEVRLEGRGHASAKAYAEEAIWLWKQAGSPAWPEESEEKEVTGILAGKV